MQTGGMLLAYNCLMTEAAESFKQIGSLNLMYRDLYSLRYEGSHDQVKAFATE